MDQLYDTEPGQPRVPLRATADGYLLVQIAGSGSGDGGSSVTNLSTTVSPTSVVVASDTGTDATIPVASTTNAGVMPPEAVVQLAGLGSASEADVGDFADAGHAHTPDSIGAATAAQGAKADAALPATADALADLLEDAATTAPADLARIQSSVSGYNGSSRRVYIGNSIVANGFLTNCPNMLIDANGSYWNPAGASGAPFARTEEYGFAAWSEAFLDAPGLIRNSGIGGNTTQDILNRVQADCLAYGPGLVIDNSGTNDIIALTDDAVPVADAAAAICARKAQLFELYLNSGARVCAPEILPRNLFTAYKTRVAVAVNNWLRQRQQVIGHHRFRVPPSASLFTNVNDSTAPIPRADYVFDGSHPNNRGAQHYGYLVAQCVADWVPPQNLYAPTMMEAFGFSSADAEIRNSSPLMGTLTAGVANTGVSGTIAAGHTCSRLSGTPTVVASVVPDPDGVGNRQRLAITFTAAGEAIEFGIPAGTSRYLNGRDNILSCSALINVAAGQSELINRMMMYSSPNVGGLVYTAAAMNQQDSTGRQPLSFARDFRARYRSPRILIPAGTAASWPSQIRIYGAAAGTVTVDISQFELRLQPVVPV